MLSFEIFKRFIFSHRAGALIKRLSIISLVQIVLSLFAFVMVLSVMNGMNVSIADRVNTIEPDLTLEVDGIKSSAALEIQPVMTRLREGNNHIDYFEQSDVILRTMDGYYKGLVAKGLTEEAFRKLIEGLQKMDNKQKSNTLPDETAWTLEEIPGPQEIVLGFDAAQTLNVFEGDWLTVIPPEALLLPQGEIPTLERVQVKKIISTRLQQVDSQIIWYLKGQTLTRLANSPSRRVLASVKLPKAEQAESIKSSLSQFEGVKITTWKERNGALFAALKLEKLCIGFILFLAGVISSFSVVMALSLLITQKQKEWALLRALGFSQMNLQNLIVKLGMWLSGAGVASGVLLGTVTALMIQFFPPSILPKIYYDKQIPAEVDPGFIVMVLLVAAGVCYWTCLRTARSMGEIKLK